MSFGPAVSPEPEDSSITIVIPPLDVDIAESWVTILYLSSSTRSMEEHPYGASHYVFFEPPLSNTLVSRSIDVSTTI